MLVHQQLVMILSPALPSRTPLAVRRAFQRWLRAGEAPVAEVQPEPWDVGSPAIAGGSNVGAWIWFLGSDLDTHHGHFDPFFLDRNWKLCGTNAAYQRMGSLMFMNAHECASFIGTGSTR